MVSDMSTVSYELQLYILHWYHKQLATRKCLRIYCSSSFEFLDIHCCFYIRQHRLILRKSLRCHNRRPFYTRVCKHQKPNRIFHCSNNRCQMNIQFGKHLPYKHCLLDSLCFANKVVVVL